jgi:hypothetical protein
MLFLRNEVSDYPFIPGLGVGKGGRGLEVSDLGGS